jgi:cytochrome d ubiquinol oxidase subunit II
VLWIVATIATWFVAPALVAGFLARPLAWLGAVVFVTGLVTSAAARRAGRELTAFLGSAAFLLGLLAATAASVYPVMIRAADDAARSLTALNASAGPRSLALGLYWWPAGALIAVVYFAVLFRLHRGKATVVDDSY